VSGTAVQPGPSGSVVVAPWQPASEVAVALGWSCIVFGFPGCGKTTFGATPKTLVIDLEGGAEVLADRPDVMVWPGLDEKTQKRKKVTWSDVEKFSAFLERQLIRGELPFEVIVWDSMTKAYKMCLQQIMGGNVRQPELREYGTANQMLLNETSRWCDLARNYSISVLFNTHAEEREIDDGKSIVIRMALTPEVIKGMVADVASIAFLEAKTVSKPGGPGGRPQKVVNRQLLFYQDTKLGQPKYRQPMTGPQLPQALGPDPAPHVSQILEHRRKLVAQLQGSPSKTISGEIVETKKS
jgi:hypothetical protein